MNYNSEWTPLRPGGANNEMKTFVSNLFSQENLAQASSVVKSRLDELQMQAQTGDWSIRLLGLVAGMALIVSSTLGFLQHFLFIEFVRAMVDAFLFVMGVVMVVLESRQLNLPETFLAKLYSYALFLKFVWGRGCLFVFAGCLQISQGGLISLVVGMVVLVVGIVYIVLGRQTAQKLQQMRAGLSDQALRSKFQEANRGGNGMLTKEQFGDLTSSLGLQLNRRELEVAFLQVSQDSGSITFDRFKSWWDTCDSSSLIV